MSNNLLNVIQANSFYNQPQDISSYQYQFLAQGDSWFSMSTANLPASSNMLVNMTFSKMAVAVNCAYPGRTLQEMARLSPVAWWRRDPFFRGLLCGPREQWWSALLLSGGGNDMIDAIQELSGDDFGSNAPNDRLLRTQAEWGSQPDVTRYIMEEGWQQFTTYLVSQYVAMDQLRQSSRYNKDVPIITHLYDFATPRNSGAGAGMGPWLYKAVHDEYGIPERDWVTLSKEFTTRLASIICALDKNPPPQAATLPPPVIPIAPLENFHVVWTLGTLDPANTTDTGPTQDWENEIHPTVEGYQKLAPEMVSVIEPICDNRHALGADVRASSLAAPRDFVARTKRRVA